MTAAREVKPSVSALLRRAKLVRLALPPLNADGLPSRKKIRSEYPTGFFEGWWALSNFVIIRNFGFEIRYSSSPIPIRGIESENQK